MKYLEEWVMDKVADMKIFDGFGDEGRDTYSHPSVHFNIPINK